MQAIIPFHLVGTIHGTESIMHPQAVPELFRRYEHLLVKPTTLIISEVQQGTYYNSTGLFCYLNKSRNYQAVLQQIFGKDAPRRIKASVTFADDRNTTGSMAAFFDFAIRPLVETILSKGLVKKKGPQTLDEVATVNLTELIEYTTQPENIIRKELENNYIIDFSGIAKVIRETSSFEYLKSRHMEIIVSGPEKAALRSIERFKNVFTDFIIVCGAIHANNLRLKTGIDANMIFPTELKLSAKRLFPFAKTDEEILLYQMFLIGTQFYDEIEKHM
jgi:hypothetical protein